MIEDEDDADDKTTASLLFVMAANSGFGVRRHDIIGNNDEGVHPPGENASTNIMNIGASLYMPAGRTALFNLERHGPAKTPYAFINSFLSEAGVSVVSFSGLSLFVLFCRRRFEPRRS
jgi:hypothetical protein